MKIQVWKLALLQLALVISFCAVTRADQPPYVAATTGIVADLVMNIAGDKIVVRGLMGPGVDPHLYRASYGDMQVLSEAKMIFFNGLHLEGKMQEVFEGLGKRKPVVAVSDGLDTARLRRPPEFSGLYDPHIWFDVSLWSQTIPRVRDQLSLILPNEKEYFTTRAAKYQAELEALDAWVKERVKVIPASRRVLITAHDAFGYFGEAYGFEVAALQGISTASEFGLADIQRLINLITSREIKAIFAETSVPQRFILSIQQGVEAQGKSVKLGGSLYSDALGDALSDAATYEGMVRKNVDTIVEALR